MRCGKALQLTLAVIKPDAVAHPLILEALHQKIVENFIIIRKKDLMWRREDSEKFYAEHAGRFFYQRLVEFMSSGPMRAYILAREDAITHWRAMMGPTKVFRARFTSPESLRGQYGLTDTRNTTHGSGTVHPNTKYCPYFLTIIKEDILTKYDSVESARREIAFFFPEFLADEWMKRKEPCFRLGPIEYNEQRQIHTLKETWL